MHRDSIAEDRVADLRSRWTPEATAAAVALLESRPVAYDLPPLEQGGETYLDLRGLRIEQTQVDKAYLRNVNLRWAIFRDVGFKNARFVGCNLSQVSFAECYLRRAQFEKCDLVNSRFDSCDFSQARMVESRIDFASFKNCEVGLQNIEFRKDSTPRAMVRVCRSLKLNAMSMGNFGDAGELTYLEKRYERLGLWQAIAGALTQVIENPNYRAQLRVKGLERAAAFSWRTTAKMTLEAYERAARTSEPEQ